MSPEKYSVADNLIETEARTSESNSDHMIGSTLETDPGLYKTVVIGSSKRVMEYLNKGLRLSICVNMHNYNIYIGEDHLTMLEKANVGPIDFSAAYARFDKSTGNITIEDFSDWRKGVVTGYGAKKAIAEAIKRDLFN